MSRVLVVEGRPEARMAIMLRDERFDVEAVAPVAALVTKALAAHAPEAVVFEVDRVDRTITALTALVMEITSAPVVLFSQRRDEREIVDGFATGAQSVFCEPIGNHEMVARVRAVLRRLPVVRGQTTDVLAVVPVLLDRVRRQVSGHGHLIQLPRKEFEIAEILMSRAGLVVPRRGLVIELWGAPRNTKSLDVQVGRLRARLAAAEGRQRIVTVRGVGYRFVVDDDDRETVAETPTTAAAQG
jgi:two-component system OmpR family response regulator